MKLLLMSFSSGGNDEKSECLREEEEAPLLLEGCCVRRRRNCWCEEAAPLRFGRRKATAPDGAGATGAMPVHERTITHKRQEIFITVYFRSSFTLTNSCRDSGGPIIKSIKKLPESLFVSPSSCASNA